MTLTVKKITTVSQFTARANLPTYCSRGSWVGDCKVRTGIVQQILAFKLILYHFVFTKARSGYMKVVWNFNSVGTNVTANSLHPGIVDTELTRYLPRSVPFYFRILLAPIIYLLGKTPLQGAQTTIYCAVEESLANVTGKYFRCVKL